MERGGKGRKEGRKVKLEGKGGGKREDNGRREERDFKEVRGTGKEEGKGQKRNGVERGRRERAE